MNNYYVYAYIRADYYTPFYIGKGKDNRVNVLSKRSKHFMNIYNKVDCYPILLYTNLTEEEAFIKETETILNLIEQGYSLDRDEIHNKEKHLVNMTLGGEGASGRVVTEAQRERLSETHKGELNPMYGKKMSEEAKRKASESLKGVQRTEEWCRKISESSKGKTMSYSAKQKMSQSHKMLNKGKTYIGVNKEGTIVEYTYSELLENGFNYSHVTECCSGKRKTHKGYTWSIKS